MNRLSAFLFSPFRTSAKGLFSLFSPKRNNMEQKFIVSASQTAEVMGSGDMPVLATPALVAMMENAAMLEARAHLQEGETTVGGSIDVLHLKPSPVGAEIRVTATITFHEERKFEFAIEALQGGALVGKATHTRFAVNRERFLSKLQFFK